MSLDGPPGLAVLQRQVVAGQRDRDRRVRSRDRNLITAVDHVAVVVGQAPRNVTFPGVVIAPRSDGRSATAALIVE